MSAIGACRARLSDGTPVWLRPLRLADAPLLRAGYKGLSERMRAQRFLAALARAALRQGIRRFRACVAPDNSAVLGFFEALGVTPYPEAPGLLRVGAELAPILERLAVTAPRG